MPRNNLPEYTNSKRWQTNSDGWVSSMHESRKRKEKNKIECNHPIEEWCENCRYTIDGERINL
jgi:hypothetical protein